MATGFRNRSRAVFARRCWGFGADCQLTASATIENGRR